MRQKTVKLQTDTKKLVPIIAASLVVVVFLFVFTLVNPMQDWVNNTTQFWKVWPHFSQVVFWVTVIATSLVGIAWQK